MKNKWISLVLMVCFFHVSLLVDVSGKDGITSFDAREIGCVKSKEKLLKELYKPAEFIPHTQPGFGTYLSYNVNFEPVDRIKKAVEKIRKIELTGRGEAHITVITPPEFGAMSRHNPEITMESIHGLVLENFQENQWSSPGVGSVMDEKKGATVFFLVVKSPDLQGVRNKIAKHWKLPKEVFDPEAQDFHVTIGFVVSDLWPPKGAKSETSLQKDLGFGQLIKTGLFY